MNYGPVQPANLPEPQKHFPTHLPDFWSKLVNGSWSRALTFIALYWLAMTVVVVWTDSGAVSYTSGDPLVIGLWPTIILVATAVAVHVVAIKLMGGQGDLATYIQAVALVSIASLFLRAAIALLLVQNDTVLFAGHLIDVVQLGVMCVVTGWVYTFGWRRAFPTLLTSSLLCIGIAWLLSLTLQFLGER